MPIGLNGAALGLLGAILAANAEPGGLGARWLVWGWGAGEATLVGIVAFRFPRAVGLPLAAAVALGVGLVVGALKDFEPVGPQTVLPSVQPLTDRELVTAFAVRVDTVDVPVAIAAVPRQLIRWRTGNALPAEWWWSWAQSQGWARTNGAALPVRPLKFGVYRLAMTPAGPVWHLEKPALTPPGNLPSSP